MLMSGTVAVGGVVFTEGCFFAYRNALCGNTVSYCAGAVSPIHLVTSYRVVVWKFHSGNTQIVLYLEMSRDGGRIRSTDFRRETCQLVCWKHVKH